MYTVTFPDQMNGYIACASGHILKTLDGGYNWTEERSNTYYDLRSLSFLDANYGFTGGLFGTILKTTDGGGVGVENHTKTSSLKISPNPATDKITISPGREFRSGTLTVFDISGKCLLEKQFSAGDIELNVGSLQAGMYYLRVLNQDQVMSGKFLKK